MVPSKSKITKGRDIRTRLLYIDSLRLHPVDAAAKFVHFAAQASAATTMTIDSASVDFWVYKDSSRFAQLEIKGASSSFGNIDLTLTVTNYDQPVTIAAPAASDIGTGTAPALP